MILLIDNYDSFTYNLVQCIGGIDPSIRLEVRRNDAVTVASVGALQPTHLVISPGPGTPDDAGISVELIRHVAGDLPILGVCLGHQCIARAFDGRIIRAERLMHGKTSRIVHDERTIYSGVANPFTATRYHSLTVDRASLPPQFEITAWSEDRREIMGIRHTTMAIEGVQFHPESFLTVEGTRLISNFLAMTPTAAIASPVLTETKGV